MSDRSARLYVRVDPAWLDRVRASAERLGLTLSAYITLAVGERVRRDEREGSRTRRAGRKPKAQG